MAESFQCRDTILDPQTVTELSLKPFSVYSNASTDVNLVREIQEDESTLLVYDIDIIASDDLTLTLFDGEEIVYKKVVVGTSNSERSFAKPLVFKTGIYVQCDSNSAEIILTGEATYKNQVPV